MAVKEAGPKERGRLSGARAEVPLHRSIYEQLLREIEEGRWAVGDRLPSEAVLCERFSASRITVAKAIGQLQRDGRVRRRAGSGTFIQQVPVSGGAALRFGLIIPDLGLTEIFEPICRGMMTSPVARPHSLTWGHTPEDAVSAEAVAEDLCRQFIGQRVNGVFFAPLEFSPDRHAANLRVVGALERAGVAIVLLDRCVQPFPERSKYDLIGIDNHRAGTVMTEHVLAAGARRPVFAARAGAGSTVQVRGDGYFSAMRASGLEYAGAAWEGDPEDAAALDAMLLAERPDALVCANDRTAAAVMQHLIHRGLRVPEEVRVTGIDDVKYARYLPVPLTTLHQNCAAMGRAAMSLMLDRLENPGRPGMEVLTAFELVVRESSGAGRAGIERVGEAG